MPGLSKRYGAERLDAACERALHVGARSYRHVASILKHGLDQIEAGDDNETAPVTEHRNLRGPGYYH